MILMSACLAGIDCKYNGGNNEIPQLKALYEKGEAVLVCPEVMGGLPTPRLSSEIQGNRVYNTAGEDVTAYFVKGAEEALRIARQNGCTLAVLKANSPSCGAGQVYDGTFSHTKIQGDGIFAALCRKEGITCLTEPEYLERMDKKL
ncbi:MAG: DUF523 domain-containing protein [Solobacterium sp.]|nr:DUF523 domain-containing protein [Solobacterium sp.]